MKVLHLQIIDGYEIVTRVSLPAVDPEKTKAGIDSLLSENPELGNAKTEGELYAEYAVPARGATNQRIVEDAAAAGFEAALAALGEREKLLSSGGKIADWRNVEFWVKGQKWEKQKIGRLGEAIPEGGVPGKDLSDSQWAEIAADEETGRISGLTPEQKEKEKNDLINAAKREATLLKSDADIAGEPFDAPAWFQAKKAGIEMKYGS
jgi:hypothetical protein